MCWRCDRDWCDPVDREDEITCLEHCLETQEARCAALEAHATPDALLTNIVLDDEIDDDPEEP